ncbi:MAG: hypothetical protein Q4G37_06135, partial [Bifidobacterium sp.]|nr:hypothetical protein [Bifidobacterium sp.]
MVTTKPTVELDKVMRFGNDTEQVEAAAKLRLGDPSALHFYKKRGWIVPDWSENLIDRAATFYMREIERGKTCLVMAGTNRLVQDLNKKIQTMRLEAGLVSHDGPTATIAEEFIIGEGDIIVTRKNKQFTIAEGSTDKVINGEQLLVQRILPDGSVLASNLSSDNHKGQWKRIPADYVAEHVQLGYASTVHRSQGATVDTAVSLVADNFNRQSLYVAMSRGKQYNLAFVALDYAFDTDAEEAHYHYLDDEQEETSEVKEEDRRIGRATAILEAIIDSDERAMSATSEEQAFADEAVSPQRIRRLWTMGREALVEKFVAKYYPEWFNTLPEWLQDAIDYHPEDNDAVENAWAALVRVGVDPRNVADGCLGNFEGVTNIPRLLGWRMRQYLPDEYEHDKEVRAAGITTDNTGDGARFQREIKRQDRHTRPDLKYSDLNHRERDAVVASVVSARQSKSVELVHDRRNPTRWLFPTFLTLKDKPELNAWLQANRPPVLNMAVDNAGPRATVDAYNRDMTGGCVYATRQVHHARLFDSSLTDCIIDLSQCAHMTLEGCELTNVEFVG